MFDCEHRTKNSGNVKTFSKSRPIKEVPGKLTNFKFQDIQSNLHTLTCKIIVQHILFFLENFAFYSPLLEPTRLLGRLE